MTRRLLLYPIVFIAFAFLIFAPTMMGQPFWDDWVFIFHSIRDQMNASSPLVFFPGGSESKSWPVFYASVWVMYKIFKTKYFLYHAVNIILHGFNGYLVWDIFRKFKVQNGFLFALLFIAHPLQLFTISWIIQFKTVLSIFFFLIALEFLIKFYYKERLPHYFAFLFLFCLSLLTKSTTVAFSVCLLFAWPIFKTKFSFKRFFVFFLLPLIFLSVAAVVRTAWTYQVKELLNNEDIRTPNLFSQSQESRKVQEYVPEEQMGEVPFERLYLVDKMTLAGKLLGRYVSFIFVPLDGYYLFQKRTNLTFNSLEFFLIVISLIALYFLIAYLWQRKLWFELMGTLFFLASMLPFCGLIFIPIFSTTNFVPYWLSIPFLGALPVMAHFLKWRPLLIGIVTVAAFVTHWQTYEFINVEDIFINSIEKAPEMKVYQISLIEHYTFTGQCARAREEYKKFKENDFSKMFCLDIKVKGCETKWQEKLKLETK